MKSRSANMVVPVAPGSWFANIPVVTRTESDEPVEIDAIFDLFAKQRGRIVDALLVDPQTLIMRLWSDYGLSNDIHCRVNLGQQRPSLAARIEGQTSYMTNNRDQCCQGCRLLRQVGDHEKLSSQFRPECGRHEDDQLVLTKLPCPQIAAKEQSSPCSMIGAPQYRGMQACQGNIDQLLQAKYYALDQLSNMLISSWYLEDILRQQGLPHIRRSYYAFICYNDAYVLQEAGAEDLHQHTFTRASFRSILYQLWALFHSLAKYNLTFSQVNKQTLLLRLQSCEYSYDGVTISGPVTLMINDLYRSGVNIYPLDCPGKEEVIHRIHTMANGGEQMFHSHRSLGVEWADEYKEVKGTACQMNQCRLDGKPSDCANHWVYRIVDRPGCRANADRLAYDNRLGLPRFNGSFDVYRLLLVLAQNESVRTILERDIELGNFWLSLWPDQSSATLLSRVKELSCGADVTPLLYGQYLRCDLLDYGWQKLCEMV